MNRGGFSPSQTGDAQVDRNLDKVATAFAGVLARLDGPLELRQTVLTLSAAIDPGNRAVRYVGAAGGVLSLPASNAQGTATGQLVAVENSTSSALTVKPSGTDLVNGGASVTVEPKALLLFASDATGGWWTSVGAFGASGTAHHGGLVPDPGATAGTVRVLFESGGWRQIVLADVSGLTSSLAALVSPVDVNDLLRKFRLLLKDYGTTLGRVPPGLEEEFSIALMTD